MGGGLAGAPSRRRSLSRSRRRSSSRPKYMSLARTPCHNVTISNRVRRSPDRSRVRGLPLGCSSATSHASVNRAATDACQHLHPGGVCGQPNRAILAGGGRAALGQWHPRKRRPCAHNTPQTPSCRCQAQSAEPESVCLMRCTILSCHAAVMPCLLDRTGSTQLA